MLVELIGSVQVVTQKLALTQLKEEHLDGMGHLQTQVAVVQVTEEIQRVVGPALLLFVIQKHR
jgi:hypothetical protein